MLNTDQLPALFPVVASSAGTNLCETIYSTLHGHDPHGSFPNWWEAAASRFFAEPTSET